MMMHESKIISPTRVAEITTWKNNCAVSCTAVFLVDAFLSKKLTERAEKNLVALINKCYGTSLSEEQLRDVFLTTITLPADRQIIVGSALKEFLIFVGMAPEEENMFSNEAFVHLASEFDFNVEFCSNVEKSIQKSDVIPPIIINPAFITIRPYFNVHHASGHFDLIMDDDKEAERHNKLAFEESAYNLSIEKFVVGQEKVLKEEVQKIISNKYNSTQQNLLNVQLEKMFVLAKSLQENSFEEATQIVMLVTDFQKSLDDFFKKSIPERKEIFDKFKTAFLAGLEDKKPQISIKEKLTGFMPFFFSTTPKQNLKAILDQIESIINSHEFMETYAISKGEEEVKKDF